MSQWNGKGGRTMTAPGQKPTSTDGTDNPMNLVGLRLWVLCALIIIAAGVSNYLLNWIVGNQGH